MFATYTTQTAVDSAYHEYNGGGHMARLRFIIGNTADFEELGIDISSCRKSVDGTKTMIHQELLDDAQVSACINAYATDGKPFYPLSADNEMMQEMLAGPDWSNGGEE